MAAQGSGGDEGDGEEDQEEMRRFREIYGNMIPEKIVDTKIGPDGRRYYKVQWRDTTMEPSKNFLEAELLIRKYWDPVQQRLVLPSERSRSSENREASSDEPGPSCSSDCFLQDERPALVNEEVSSSNDVRHEASLLLPNSQELNTSAEDGVSCSGDARSRDSQQSKSSEAADENGASSSSSTSTLQINLSPHSLLRSSSMNQSEQASSSSSGRTSSNEANGQADHDNDICSSSSTIRRYSGEDTSRRYSREFPNPSSSLNEDSNSASSSSSTRRYSQNTFNTNNSFNEDGIGSSSSLTRRYSQNTFNENNSPNEESIGSSSSVRYSQNTDSSNREASFNEDSGGCSSSSSVPRSLLNNGDFPSNGDLNNSGCASSSSDRVPSTGLRERSLSDNADSTSVGYHRKRRKISNDRGSSGERNSLNPCHSTQSPTSDLKRKRDSSDGY